MTNVEQTQKMIPFVTCEISLGQYVCELVFGVTVFYLDFGVQIDSIKKPIKSNPVGSGNMSHCRASSLYDHLNHFFVVFKHIQQSFLMRRLDVWRNTIYLIQNDCSLRSLAGPVTFVTVHNGLQRSIMGLNRVFQGQKQSDPTNRERESRPISIQRPKKRFMILLNSVKLKFVCYISN